MKKQTNWQQFKAFAFKGNMIDLALAVALASAVSLVTRRRDVARRGGARVGMPAG